MRVRPAFVLALAAIVAAPTFADAAENSPVPESSQAQSTSAAEEHDRAGLEFFEAKIRPALVKHCYQCHSSKAKSPKGGLLLDTRSSIRAGGDSGPAVVPGNVDESLLISAIRYESYEMPPKGKLDESVIADMARWVEMGAPDPRGGATPVAAREIDVERGRQYWAFQPPTVVQPPTVSEAAWAKSDIDRYILAGLDREGLRPVPAADRYTLIRRATLDLTGLPPTPEEIEAFLADGSSDAFAKVVDRLLASPRYGERWGRFWLDLARYGESSGKERNYAFPHAWRYRDYVIDSFNADTPYDAFLTEQIAGDLLPTADAAERDRLLIATGFLAIGPKSLNERDRDQYTMDVVDEQIDVTCRTALALTASCARCHDHKFDPIPTADYYAMAGIFKSTRVYAGVTRGNRYQQDESELAAIGGDAERIQAILDARDEMADLESQIARMKKKGKAVAAKASAKTDAKKTSTQPVLLEAAGAAAKETSSDSAKKRASDEVLAEIARVEARMDELRPLAEAELELAMAVGENSNIANCQICIRGEVHDLGAEAPRGFIRVVGASAPTIDPATSGRLELAAWLTSRDNPLTARVMANRVWHHLMGAGIVRTVDDFGVQGEQPSHRELLDYLAVRFMDEGWSIKRLIREIMLTSTYQLSAAHDDANYERDADNRLLWRHNRKRLDAEAIRDSILAASGQLDVSRPVGTVVAEMTRNDIARTAELTRAQNDSRLRSVYLPLPRGFTYEMLAAFDAADPSLVVGRREVTTVATQALLMMNSQFVVDQSSHAAERVLDGADEDRSRADRAVRLILARPAAADEIERMTAFVDRFQQQFQAAGASADQAERDAWRSACQTLFASGEFRYVY